MNLPNCVPGMQAGDLKDLGAGLADFRAAYQQQQAARQQFVPPANLLAPQQVRQFANWPTPHAQTPFGYQPYPYQLYPNQPQLPGWPQVGQVPDLKAALQLPQPQPLASLSSDVSQSSREEAQLASFLQAQQTFLQRGSTSLSSSLAAPSAPFGTSPSRRPPASSASPSCPLAAAPTGASSAASYPPDRQQQQQPKPPLPDPPSSRRGPTPIPAPAPSTSFVSHASHATAAPHALSPLPAPPGPPAPPTHLSDDLLMRVVRGDASSLSHATSHAPHPLHPAPSSAAASHPGSMWSKPTHTSAPHPHPTNPPTRTKPPAAPAAANPPAAPSSSSRPAPAPSQQASAALDARVAALQATPAAVKALLGSADYYRARTAMLGHQEVFLQQLHELHRLVATQKLLAAELASPEHSHTLVHHTVSQQKAQLEQQLTRDLHLLRNIPATLRNPWVSHAPLDPPPTASKFRITKDSPHGKALPRPAPQHPTSRARAPGAGPASPRGPSTALPPVPLELAPPPAASKPPATLIRPVPTALTPPPALYQPVDIHSMWVAKHGASASACLSTASGKPQPSTSLAPISLPSQMTGQQLTGLSSDCIASFGLGLSSLSGCTNSLGLKEPPTQQRTRVRYWWQDEAGAFADVALPDDLQLHSRTRGESSSVAVSARDRGDPSAPPKKRAKFKEGSQTPSAQAAEGPLAINIDRVQPGERQQAAAGGAAVASPLVTAKEVAGKARPTAATGKKQPRSKRTSATRAAGPHSGDSGSSECSAPTQERTHMVAESKPQPAPAEPAAAVSKEDTVTDHRSDAVAGQSTAHSAANILLSISSSFRPA